MQALSDVSFELYRGETLGVVGESGSGKSTLARALMALPAPDSGSVQFDGQSVYEARGAQLRALRFRMQMVFQDPMSSLNPAHSILDVVEMPLLVAGRGDARQRRAAAMKTLRSVGLDGELIGGRRSYELSGGQCQRVSIARALTLSPDLLVCDEPVSALDVSVQAQVLNLLEDAKAGARAHDAVHLARPGRGERHQRPRDGDVPRQGLRDRAGRRALREAAPSVQRHPAGVRAVADAEPPGPAVGGAARRDAFAAGGAVGVPLPDPLHACHRPVHAGRAADRRGR